MKSEENIVIVGAGLSGLTLAYLLTKKNIKTTILEASSRIGGRIHTVKGKLDTPLELGATWFSDIHINLINLLDELGLETFTQYTKGKSLYETRSFGPPDIFSVPESQESSYRIAGGTQVLIHKLLAKASFSELKLNNSVLAINQLEDRLLIETSMDEEIIADKVILCLPPKLAGERIKFSPKLPASVLSILPSVQTWMAGSIKFVIEYKAPFWRKNGFSGMLFSRTGIVAEMHDHMDYTKNLHGFTGFLNPNAVSYSEEFRKKLVVNQLEKLLGSEASSPASYFDKIWKNEFVSNETPGSLILHQNNGHPVFKESYYNNSLFFSGTESSNEFSGYMEGAVISAKAMVDRIFQ